MHSMIRRRPWGTAAATGLLIVSTMFGVLLMHSVTPTTSMTGGHASVTITSPSADESSVPVAFGEHHRPSAHQIMHPCAGTTVSWTTLTVPATSAEIGPAPTSADRIGVQADSTLARAPPWNLWELDRSVTLRV